MLLRLNIYYSLDRFQEEYLPRKKERKERMRKIEEKSKFCLSSALKTFLHDFLCRLIPCYILYYIYPFSFFLPFFAYNRKEEQSKEEEKGRNQFYASYKHIDTKFNGMESNTTEGKDFKNKVRIYFELRWNIRTKNQNILKFARE